MNAAVIGFIGDLAVMSGFAGGLLLQFSRQPDRGEKLRGKERRREG